MTNKCGDCAFLITEEGEPYYCATRDLYTLRNANDKACGEFVDKLTAQDKEAVQDLMAFKERYTNENRGLAQAERAADGV